MVHKQSGNEQQRAEQQRESQQNTQNISSLNPAQQDDADDVLQAFIQEKDPNGERC